jgi:hemoglobin
VSALQKEGSMLELHRHINRENLRALMTSFYEKAIEDDMLAPFFVGELGENLDDEEWIEHIELLADFWLAKILGEDTYYGNFIGAHAKMPHIKRETYDRWLDLFAVTADEVYPPEIAAVFKKKGLQFTRQFLTTDKNI